MAVSLSSIACFSSTVKNLQTRNHHLPKSCTLTSPFKANQLTSTSSTFGSRKPFKENRLHFCLSVADRNQLATENNDEGPASVGNSFSVKTSHSLDNQEVSNINDNSRPSDASGVSNGSLSSDQKEKLSSSSNSQSEPKRSPLTARERVRAARVLGRYTETKPSKPDLGSKVLDALKESDRGKKRSILPEAPTNLFDDSKRGLPKPGLTFQFPGGSNLFFIVLSFTLISALMFATTYIVWKVGAIHFNEY